MTIDSKKKKQEDADAWGVAAAIEDLMAQDGKAFFECVTEDIDDEDYMDSYDPVD